tara:strand:+ start:26600 stop:27181 length:582 start_codon:yes stop_codon:yes gene_type:complete
MKALNEFLNEGKKFKEGSIVTIKDEYLDDPSEKDMEYKVVNVNNGTKRIIIEPIEFDGGIIKPEQVVGMNMVELKESINEGFESEGKSLKDLLKAIKKLPDTISSISVPVDLKTFASQSIKIEPTDKNWRKEVEKTLKETLKGKDAKAIDTFQLKSYFGRGGKATDSYYIKLSSQGSRDFASDMGKGKFGSLD